MKLWRMGSALGFATVVACFSACGKEDKHKEVPVGNNDSKAPQEEMYLKNVASDKPLLVVYGDSISTGVLANTRLGQNIDNSLLVQLANSIKAGQYRASALQSNLANQDLAASTTENDYGLRSAIATKAGLKPADIGVVSFAKFGAKAADIPAMLARWNQEESNNLHRKPDYILVALGGNDFCSDMTTDAIVKTYTEQIDAIQKSAPDAQLILSPAPPVHQLAGIDFTYGPSISAITGEELTCKKFREQACKRIYEPDAQARLEAINKGIEAAYQAEKDKGAKVSYAAGALSWKITPEELAFDCFHPSQQGQVTLGGYWKQALPQE